MPSSESYMVKQLRERAIMLSESVRDELDWIGELLWYHFLQHDRELTGVLEREELGSLVIDVFGNSDREFINIVLQDIEHDLEEEDEDFDGQTTFVELLEWLTAARASGLFGAAVDAQLQLRSVGLRVSSLFRFTPFEEQLSRRVRDKQSTQLQCSVENLEKTLYDVKVLKAHEQSRRLEESEKQKIKKYHKNLFGDKEKRSLAVMYTQLLAVEGRELLAVEKDVPKIAALLGHKLTFEESVVTKLCHGDSMDFNEFLKWWACRTVLRS